MIRKLRVKFIIINMSLVTIMLCIILSMVYQYTKIKLETENISMMQNIAANPFQAHLPNEAEEGIRLPYFTLQIDTQHNILAILGGYYDLSDEQFIKDILEETLSSSKPYDTLKDYNLRYYRMTTPISENIVYSDISSELITLRNLIKSSVFIGILSFFLFLAISFFLADWAVKPVERAWTQQRQFVADASHELKTPLTVIMTNAELLQNPEYDDNSRISFTRNILTMSKQMHKLIEQMLELARSDASASHLIFSPLSFSGVLSGCLLPFEPIFFEKGLHLKAHIQEDIRVNGSKDALRQVVNILLDNARKYSRENGTTYVTLQKCGTQKPSHLFPGRARCILSVTNEGEPIAPDDLKNLFKRFYRADKARSRTGSFGLGLSIAEAIVTQHKGKIWAESTDGRNSFFVELPCL